MISFFSWTNWEELDWEEFGWKELDSKEFGWMEENSESTRASDSLILTSPSILISGLLGEIGL